MRPSPVGVTRDMKECAIRRLQHTRNNEASATHYNVQRTATHCNTLQNTATHCATHCNALQHTRNNEASATHYNVQRTATHCNALQRTATHCNALQRTAHGTLKSAQYVESYVDWYTCIMIIGLFCGKWPITTSNPMRLHHPVGVTQDASRQSAQFTSCIH